MAGRFNYERAASALVDAAYLGDKQAAERHGITARSIRNYRQRLQEDRELSELFQHKRALAEQDWAHELAPAIRASIDFLRRAAQRASTRDADVIHSVAGALKILSNVAMTKEVLDARFAHTDRSSDPEA
jgi:hypothetical protein